MSRLPGNSMKFCELGWTRMRFCGLCCQILCNLEPLSLVWWSLPFVVGRWGILGTTLSLRRAKPIVCKSQPMEIWTRLSCSHPFAVNTCSLAKAKWRSSDTWDYWSCGGFYGLKDAEISVVAYWSSCAEFSASKLRRGLGTCSGNIKFHGVRRFHAYNIALGCCWCCWLPALVHILYINVICCLS